MRSSLVRLLPLLLAGALSAACGDAPTDPLGAAPTAELGFSLNLSGTDVRLMVVEVTAPDITQPLVYDINVNNGTASGRIEVPAGVGRTIHVRAYDYDRVQTHEGSATLDVKPGSNPPVTVTLTPAAGRVPINVNFGSLVVSVRAVDGPNTPTGEYTIGAQARFEAVVTRADGTPVPGAAVRWASLNPGVASVGADGMVTMRNAGITEIAATYNGYGASMPVTVTPRTDFAAPTLTALSFDRTTLAAPASGNTLVHLMIHATDDLSGIASMWVEIRGVAQPWTGWNCAPAEPASPGVYDCSVPVYSTQPADDYIVSFAQFTDAAGNTVSYTKADLAARGIAPRLTVTRN